MEPLPPKEGHWFARPKPVRRTLKKLPDLAVIPALIATFGDSICRMLGLQVPGWFPKLQVVGYGLLFALFVIWKVNETVARRTLKADLQLSDRPEGIVEYLVEAVIFVDGKELAVDRGVVWFEEELLHFSGAATSFVLAATDIRPSVRFDPFGEEMKWMMLARPRTNAAIRLLPLSGFRNWGFRWAIRRFVRKRESVLKPRQWPPLHAFGEALEERVVERTPEEIGQAAARDGIGQGVVRS